MNKVYKTVLAVAATAIVAGASMAPVAVSAWGDSSNGRATYTLSSVKNLGKTITFNSITNGKIGDERNFVGAKLSNSTSATWNADEITVKDGDIVTIRLYVHNNNPNGTKAIAEGVSASFSLPTTVSKSHTVIGYLNSSNATPNRYWDEVKLNSSDDFYLEYVEGSAKYTNTNTSGSERTFNLSNDVITSGVKLGYDAMDGKIPGCYEYDGQVTIQLKVHSSVTSKLAKTVRMKGTKEWFEAVDAKVGDEVEYQIEYQNLSADQVDNVVIRDILPDNMEYVKGSTIIYNGNHPNGVGLSDDVVTSGINIGSYVARGNAFVRFTARVVSENLVCGTNQLVNWASATVNSKIFKDDASVLVKKDDASCQEKKEEEPKKEDNKATDITDKPTQIVNTGAGDVAGAALGAGSLITALGYYIASRKKLM